MCQLEKPRANEITEQSSKKPGTWNIPEHSGTSQNIPEHPGTSNNYHNYEKNKPIKLNFQRLKKEQQFGSGRDAETT